MIVKMEGCDNCMPSNSSTHHDFLTNNEANEVLILMTLISYLKWTSICVFYEEGTERKSLDLVRQLSQREIFVVTYHISEVTSSNIDALASMNLKNLPDRLNFTLLCSNINSSCLPFLRKDVIKKEYDGKKNNIDFELFEPFRYDRKDVWRNSLLHFSRWIVMVSDISILSSLQNTTSIMFDNVAVLYFEYYYDKNPSIERNVTCTKRGFVSTLLWKGNRERQMSPVGIIHKNETLNFSTRVFPNVKFGFNGRRFLISILTWHPFTFIDEETKQYSGFMIDMLKEMSHVMNFTYDLREPEDGNWGALENEESNTWNGLVGELQRRDVDIVFAPITINPHRETVMDFTHPFYYEFSAILLKKPNINDSRWTTLMEIFSPKVMMFIGSSLLVVSGLLFVYEKYSPYYRHERHRKGLHQFSDSFWYMYGALLTQGGENMAEASSGRTILTSWWIFCIILAAAYSGNFVAFLTVYKEKLPFSNIEDLIQQDTYKWGTLGSSIYETILKTSDLPERIDVWNKMVKFNRTDPTVLSSSISDQIQKVLNSNNYAFIGDITGMELALLTNCELTTATSDLLPLQYGLGLPNNSPFIQLFSDEIIVTLESGLIPMWKKKYLPKPAKCQTDSKAKQVTIFDVQLAFYLIGLGIVLAFLCLCFECLKQKLQQCRTYGNEHSNKPEKDDCFPVGRKTKFQRPVSNRNKSQIAEKRFRRRNNSAIEFYSYYTGDMSPVSQAIDRQVWNQFTGSDIVQSEHRVRKVLDII